MNSDTEESIQKSIEQVSASMGLDFEDEELTESQKGALLQYYNGLLSKEELERAFGGNQKWV